MKRLKDKKLFDNINSFLSEYLPTIRNKSDNTISTYRMTLKLYILFFEQVKGVDVFELVTEMLTRDSIVEFLNWLGRNRGCCASTRNNRLSCIRTFYKYLALHCDPSLVSMMGDIAEIQKERVIKDQPPVVLTEEEVSLVLAAPDANTRIGIRDRFYLTMMYDSAGRSDEILSLKVQDLTITGETSKIHVIGKGGKSRMIPISEKATALMRQYLKLFHPVQEKNQYLFYVESNGQKRIMSADNAARIMKKYELIVKQKHPNLPHLHPHLWRHTRAQQLYSAGMPLPLISEWLGHSNMETSLIYAHSDVEMKRKAIEKATNGENPLIPKEFPKFMNDKDIIKKLYGLA